jgi:hypothetical protein
MKDYVVHLIYNESKDYLSKNSITAVFCTNIENNAVKFVWW